MLEPSFRHMSVTVFKIRDSGLSLETLMNRLIASSLTICLDSMGVSLVNAVKCTEFLTCDVDLSGNGLIISQMSWLSASHVKPLLPTSKGSPTYIVRKKV